MKLIIETVNLNPQFNPQSGGLQSSIDSSSIHTRSRQCSNQFNPISSILNQSNPGPNYSACLLHSAIQAALSLYMRMPSAARLRGALLENESGCDCFFLFFKRRGIQVAVKTFFYGRWADRKVLFSSYGTRFYRKIVLQEDLFFCSFGM